QRDRAEQAGFTARDVPGGKQGRNDETVDLDVERIERPAAETPGHGPPLSGREIPHPLKHSQALPNFDLLLLASIIPFIGELSIPRACAAVFAKLMACRRCCDAEGS